jgi:hypothetical protein
VKKAKGNEGKEGEAVALRGAPANVSAQNFRWGSRDDQRRKGVLHYLQSGAKKTSKKVSSELSKWTSL